MKTTEQYEAEIKVLVEALENIKTCISTERNTDGVFLTALISRISLAYFIEQTLSTYQAQAEVWRRKEQAVEAMEEG